MPGRPGPITNQKTRGMRAVTTRRIRSATAAFLGVPAAGVRQTPRGPKCNVSARAGRQVPGKSPGSHIAFASACVAFEVLNYALSFFFLRCLRLYLATSGPFMLCLASCDHFWPRSAAIAALGHYYWHLDTLWATLDNFGPTVGPLGHFGHFCHRWHLLASSWLLLTASGCFWPFYVAFGQLGSLLATFGHFWPLSATFLPPQANCWLLLAC